MEKQITQHDKVDAEMRNIIEEARVILPGVQALFGFQTIAVFNQRFDDLVSYAKACHILGLGMVIVTIAMVMTPAVSRGGNATVSMARVSSWMIRGALGPLSLGLALDVFTVIYAATSNVTTSIMAAVGTFLLLAAMWFVLPALGSKRSRFFDERQQ